MAMKRWPDRRVKHPGPTDRMRARMGVGPAAKPAPKPPAGSTAAAKPATKTASAGKEEST